MFKHNYSYNLISETTGLEGQKFYYPGASRRGGVDGLILRIDRFDKDAWIGMFACGNYGPNTLTGIYTTPDPDQICVVAKGNAFFVKTNDPEDWQQIQAVPVTNVICIPKKQTIIFSDFTNLVAYGDHGLKWRSNRLTFDDLRITSYNDSYIEGEFFDIRSESTEKFSVNVDNGESSGGI